MSAGEKRGLDDAAGNKQDEVSKEQPVSSTEPSNDNVTEGDRNENEPASKRTRAEAEEAHPIQNPVHTPSVSNLQSAAHVPQHSVIQGGSGPWPEGMKPAVREKLESLFASGRCRRDEIDLKIMQSLSEFPEAVGLQILSNFSDADMTSIRNKSAFLAGVMKRFRTEHPISSAHPPSTMGAYGPGLGGLSSSISADTGGMLPTVHARLEQIFASGKVSFPFLMRPTQ